MPSIKMVQPCKTSNFLVGHMPRKTSAVARCFYGLEILQLLQGTAVSIPAMTYSRVDSEVRLHFLYMVVHLLKLAL